jgi:hypothetical protein
MPSNNSVFGIFKTRSAVEMAIDELMRAGFRNSDFSLLLPHTVGTRELAHEKSSKAPEGAVVGGGAGALLGGTLGALIGLGLLVIPGLGPFLAAGPLMAALAGASVGGAVGGVTGGLIGMGVPEYEAKRYEGFVQNGGILMSVHADTPDKLSLAEEILEACGAHDVSAAQEESAELPSEPMVPLI